MNILHFVDNRMMRLASEEPGESVYQFQAEQLVVDIMGGEKVDVGRVSPVEYQIPGEILLMDENGNVLVQNAQDSKDKYLLRSQSMDEVAEYNAGRRRPRSEGPDDRGDGRGGGEGDDRGGRGGGIGGFGG